MQVHSTHKFVGNKNIGDTDVKFMLKCLSNRRHPLEVLSLTGNLYSNMFICTGTGITIDGAQRFAPLLSKAAKVLRMGKLHTQAPNMSNLDDTLQFFGDLAHVKSLLAKGVDPSVEDNYGKSLNDMMCNI